MAASTLEKLVNANRTYRAFDESAPIPRDTMIALVDLARHVASANNKQPLRYRVISERAEGERVLALCRFAGLLQNVKLPPEGQHPTGYIVIYSDEQAGSTENSIHKDVGIAAQTILLGAAEAGFGGCMVGSFHPEKLRELFATEARYTPRLVLVMGKPAELAVLTEAKDGNVTYYRDENNVHYVPKRKLEDILL